MTEIRHLPRKGIDTARWDRCVEASGQGIAFGFSHYLDIMTDDWHGLVMGDYDAVFPLPVRTKLGIRYAYPPRFMGPHPVYSRPGTHPDVMDFIDAAGQALKFSDMQLAHPPTGIRSPHSVRKNHMLPLAASYGELSSAYRATFRNLVSKGLREGIAAVKGEDAEEAIRRATRDGMMEGCSGSDLSRFRTLCREMTRREACYTISALDGRGEPLSMGIFFMTDKRIHYMASWTGLEGRKTGASRIVIDALVREHAGGGKTLDFMGSDIPGIATFFEGFGATAEDYVLVRQNRLPFWLRRLKKPLPATYNRKQSA